MEGIKYYAVARNTTGKLEQLLVTRSEKERKQEWTGKTYRSMREATADLAMLNRGLGRNAR
jgi:hypothetical protein